MVAAVVVLLCMMQGASAQASTALARARSTATSATRASQPPAADGSLFTYDYNNARSGVDPSTAPITHLSSRPVWDDANLGQVYAEPLLDGAMAYVVTEEDELIALSARTGKLAWRLSVGSPVSASVRATAPGAGCGNIDPLGITSTPVIDPARRMLYLVAETLQPGQDWRGIAHVLVAVSLTRHAVVWTRDVDPPGANEPGQYYVAAQLQRPAVTLAFGRLYVAFGGLYGDCGQYHGFITSLPQSGRGALGVYQVPSAREGAIWETNGLVVANRSLYVATGNGASTSAALYDEGDSVLALTPGLSRRGNWAPRNWFQLNQEDADLGSAGPIPVPGTSLLFAAGKGAVGYLVDATHLGGVGGRSFSGPLCKSGGDYGANAAARLSGTAYVFAACGGGIAAVTVDGRAGTFRRVWSSAGSGPPIVAGGLVLSLDWGAGRLYAMVPTTGRVRFSVRTARLEHFATPSVGDSRVLVPTASGVEAFALR